MSLLDDETWQKKYTSIAEKHRPGLVAEFAFIKTESAPDKPARMVDEAIKDLFVKLQAESEPKNRLKIASISEEVERHLRAILWEKVEKHFFDLLKSERANTKYDQICDMHATIAESFREELTAHAELLTLDTTLDPDEIVQRALLQLLGITKVQLGGTFEIGSDTKIPAPPANFKLLSEIGIKKTLIILIGRLYQKGRNGLLTTYMNEEKRWSKMHRPLEEVTDKRVEEVPDHVNPVGGEKQERPDIRVFLRRLDGRTEFVVRLRNGILPEAGSRFDLKALRQTAKTCTLPANKIIARARRHEIDVETLEFSAREIGAMLDLCERHVSRIHTAGMKELRHMAP